MPDDLAGAGDGEARRGPGVTSAPIASRISRSASPAWVVCCGQPGTCTRAAGDQRGGEERRRVGQVGLDLHVEGVDRPARPARRSGSLSSTIGAGVAQHLDGHLDVRLGWAPACRRGAPRRPRRSAAPASSSAETNCEDAEASSVTGAAGQPSRVPCTVNGSAPRPSSSTSAPEGAQRVEHRRHRALAGLRVAVEARPGRRRARPPAAGSA